VATLDVIKQHPAAFKTITFSTGTEFHDYKRLEVGSNLRCYFAISASYQMLRPNDVSTARWVLRNASTKRC
jgi:IS30 family transposase